MPLTEAEIFEIVWERDNGVCQMCGKPCSRYAWPPPAAHHVKHKGMGGPGKRNREAPDHPDNRALVCYSCHTWHHDKRRVIQ